MAAQVDDHRADGGPELVERFALLWPRAVQTRRRRPAPLRRARVGSGLPGVPRISLGHLSDVMYNRDLWMHRVDLARATGQPLVIGNHDRHIVEQSVRDLALTWSAAPLALELTGPAGGHWLVGSGEPTATVSVETVAYMRALAGRDTDVAVQHVPGDESILTAVRHATIVF